MLSQASTLLQKIFHGARQGVDDILMSLLPQVLTIANTLLIAVLVARGLGSEQMGMYALVISIPTVVMSISDFGVGATAIRYASQALAQGDSTRQHAVIRWAFRIRILAVTVMCLLAYVAIPYLARHVWHAGSLPAMMRLSLIAAVFNIIATVPYLYFQSMRRFRANAVINILPAAMSMAAASLLYLSGFWSLAIAVMIFIFNAGSSALVGVAIAPSTIFFSRPRPWYKGNLHLAGFWRLPTWENQHTTEDSASFALFMMLSSIIWTLTMKLDIWVAGYFLDKAAIGLYSLAMRVPMPLLIVSVAFDNVLWPRISALGQPQQSMSFIRKFFKFNVLAMLAGLVYTMLAPLLMPVVFGDQYRPAILLAQLLCLRYCIILLILPITNIGYNFGLVRFYFFVKVGLFGMVAAMNILLLPRIGMLSAALALIAYDTLGAVCAGTRIWSLLRHKACPAS